MPNFSLIVSNQTNNTGFASSLSTMIDSSDFVCRYYFDLNVSNVFRLAKNISITVKNKHKQIWMVTVTPENPERGSGPWYCLWRFLGKNFKETFFRVSRPDENDINGGSFKSMHLSLSPNETTVVSFDYSEAVRETFYDGTIHEFDITMNENYIPSDPSVDFNVELYITMHPWVSYWKEYLDYTPEDALSSLGGILNIISFVYFWVAYYIAVNMGHHSYEMGILPEMSFIFSNLEKILLIKECLEKNNIIPKESRWFGRPINTPRVTGTNSDYNFTSCSENSTRKSIISTQALKG
jgi:hypothetical protein